MLSLQFQAKTKLRKEDYSVLKEFPHYTFGEWVDFFSEKEEDESWIDYLSYTNKKISSELLHYLFFEVNDVIYTMRYIKKGISCTNKKILFYLLKRNYNKCLKLCSKKGYINLVSYLILKYRANPHDYNQKSFILSAKHGHLETLKFLFDHTKEEVHKDTMIYFSCTRGHIEVVRFLLSLDPNETYRFWSSIIITKTYKNEHIGIVFLLLDILNERLIFEYDKPIVDLILLASEYGDLENLKLFLQRTNNFHDFSKKCLLLASKNGHAETVKYLLDVGTNPTSIEYDSLRYMYDNGHIDATNVLFEHRIKDFRLFLIYYYTRKFAEYYIFLFYLYMTFLMLYLFFKDITSN